jgi:hypothetical protein
VTPCDRADSTPTDILTLHPTGYGTEPHIVDIGHCLYKTTWCKLLITITLCSGGEEVLLDVGGQDATEAFEDVGHSDEAREILEGLLVGSLKRQPGDPAPKVGATDKIAAGPGGRSDAGTGMGIVAYAVLLVGAAVAYFGYSYLQTSDKK